MASASARLSLTSERYNDHYMLYHLNSFRKNLPLKVRFSSQNLYLEKHSLFTNTVLEVHCIKTTQAAILACQGKQYILPLSSFAEFSPLYNPDNDVKKALAGYQFFSVDHLLKTHPKPIAVYAIEGFLSDNVSSTIYPGDIYIIDGSRKDCDATLICKDAQCSTLKRLPSHLPCTLTTDPKKLCMCPSEFILDMKLPAKVIYSGPFQSVLQIESNRIFTVTEITTISSLIATVPPGAETVCCVEYDVVEIYLDLLVEIEVLSFSQTINTEPAFSYTPKITIFDEEKYTNDDFQHLLFSSNFVSSNEKVSKNCSYKTFQPFPELLNTKSMSISNENSTGIARIKHRHTCTMPRRLRGNYDRTDESYAVTDNNNETDVEYDYARTCALTRAEIIARFCNTAGKEDSSTEKGKKETNIVSNNEDSQSCSLSTSSETEVADLLDKLGIGQYRETFLSERICGGLLMELDDDILMNELGIMRKLDRLRLLQIIKGKQSILDIV